MKIGKQSAARTSTGGAKNPSELGLKKTSKEGGWDAAGQKDEKKSRGQISLVNFLPFLGHSKICENLTRLERFGNS